MLIQECSLEFAQGLNIISGETGSGKTALIDAIALVLGERAESALIRHGEERAIVEGSFEVERQEGIAPLLEVSGIPHDPSGWLTIRREIAANGKNRAFINSFSAPLELVQKVGSHLVDLFTQHSFHTLRQSAYHRTLLDAFASVDPTLKAYQSAYAEQQEVSSKIEELKAALKGRDQEVGYYSHVVQEIEEAAIKEGEDEALFAEYGRLAHAGELTERLNQLNDEINEADDALIVRIHAALSRLQGLAAIEERIQTPLNMLLEAKSLVSEASSEIGSLLSSIEHNPMRKEELEGRLKQIDALKKKYGKTLLEIEEKREEAAERLHFYEQLDESLLRAQKRAQELIKEVDTYALLLTQRRKEAALLFSKEVTRTLSTLNMEGSLFEAKVLERARCSFGDDEVVFYLKANAGEKSAPVHQRASGGELSRLMLAITAQLAEKNRTETLLFDEIDANIGGQTATQIGKALQALSNKRQVICITHFPQVAKWGHAHYRVSKGEKNERTVAHAEQLSKEGIQQELTRMLGDL